MTKTTKITLKKPNYLLKWLLRKKWGRFIRTAGSFQQDDTWLCTVQSRSSGVPASAIFYNMVFRPISNTGKPCNILKCLSEEKTSQNAQLLHRTSQIFPKTRRYCSSLHALGLWLHCAALHASRPSLRGTARAPERAAAVCAWLSRTAGGVLVPGPGTEPGPQTVPSPDHRSAKEHPCSFGDIRQTLENATAESAAAAWQCTWGWGARGRGGPGPTPSSLREGGAEGVTRFPHSRPPEGRHQSVNTLH